MSNKREEAIKTIDNEVAAELCLYCSKNDLDGTCNDETPCAASLVTARTIREIYHSQGVVIKVDRELPKNRMGEGGGATLDVIISPSVCRSWCDQTQQDMLEAGYTAVEPLIEFDKRKAAIEPLPQMNLPKDWQGCLLR